MEPEWLKRVRIMHDYLRMSRETDPLGIRDAEIMRHAADLESFGRCQRVQVTGLHITKCCLDRGHEFDMDCDFTDPATIDTPRPGHTASASPGESPRSR